ncbi:MAG: hypothetical protein HY265_04760 [Deltaproteobacteria bacterium]|nr:hypothetical protein [Deltaproteobacteria bacterium]MBI3755455.1 hypothetical protein [Deltaproteobacteria bacterium]
MKRTITILYFKDNTGKIHTVEFSIKNLKLLIFILSILIFVSIISTIFSTKLYMERNRLIKDFTSLSIEKEALEKKINDIEATINKSGTVSNPAVDSTAKSQISRKEPVEAKSAAKKTLAGREEAKDIDHISLQNFQVKNTEDNGQIIIAFDIVKTDNSSEMVNGYLLIVGDYGGTYFCFPEDAGIKDGMPVDFKKGSRFFIKRQKRLEFALPYSINNPINKIITFVYSSNGNLLIEKEVNL